jgi:hypothetical protein
MTVIRCRCPGSEPELSDLPDESSWIVVRLTAIDDEKMREIIIDA